MNARTESLTERSATDYFVFGSTRDEHVFWLTDTLMPLGAVESAALDAQALVARIASINPSLVFIDFTGGDASAASAAAAAVRAEYPGLQVVALGSLGEPMSTVAALRAGVRDFIDVDGTAADAQRITRHVLDNLAQPVNRHGRVCTLLGARAGMGVSTLAANLSVMLQGRGRAQQKQAVLLDLGLPQGDGMLYLNTRNDFSFVDAVRNVRRFDQTLVHTALSHHASGLAVMSLPADLGAMRDISHAASVGLVHRLRSFFDQQVIDVGGLSNLDFIAQMVGASDEAWLVCDQGIASIVSAVALVEAFKERGASTGAMQLVINKFDAGLGLSAEQIAQRVQLPLAAVLPARAVPIGRAVNQGELIAEVAMRDPYVRALEPLAARIAGDVSRVQDAAGKPARGVAGLAAIRRFISTSHRRSG